LAAYRQRSCRTATVLRLAHATPRLRRETARRQFTKTGNRLDPAGRPVRNEILLSMPDHEYEAALPHLEFLNLPHHLTLHEPNRSIEYAYFLNRGLVSLVVETADGKTVEVGVAGNEGVAGVPSSVGLKKSPLREVMQIAGEGFRIAVRPLQKILMTTPELRNLLSRYAVIQGLQFSQTAACNRLHEVGQRLARWLLMVQDRVDSGTLPITHDFLATMLGTDRPSVTLAAGSLQRRGAIEYTRGAVKILRRQRLEAACCECYQVMRRLGNS
jgi:CRP-like cAMP-binding protein